MASRARLQTPLPLPSPQIGVKYRVTDLASDDELINGVPGGPLLDSVQNMHISTALCHGKRDGKRYIRPTQLDISQSESVGGVLRGLWKPS